MINNKKGEKNFGGNAQQDQSVGEYSQGENRLAKGTAGEDIGDLGDDDAGQTGGGGLEIEGVYSRQQLPPLPATPMQDVKEAEKSGRSFDGSQKEIRSGQEPEI